MAITKLTNTQINELVNAAYAQATGQTSVETQLDLKDFCETGTAEIGADLREKFTGALLGVLTKNWYLDTSYRSSYSDDFYVDSQQFGAITQMISVDVPEAKANPSWNDFVSGTSTVGQYTVYLPSVSSRFFHKSESFSIPIAITGQQWDTAFRNATELAGFVAYVWTCVDNAMLQHMEDMNNLNRANFIAEKVNAANTNVDGIHVVDLVKGYCVDTGRATAMTVAEFLNTKAALIYAMEQIKLYMGYIQKQTALFNTAGKVRFTPKERLVVQLLTYFETRLAYVAESSTFHADMIALPGHSSVPAWQSIADTSFDGLSSINVKIANPEGGDPVEVEQGGIVGLIADKWSIIHTIRSKRVAVQHFDIEDLTLYDMQQRDSYMNNLDMNAVIFILSAYTPA